eukprot:4337972-Lingulodinium_polyedra.AAC.1
MAYATAPCTMVLQHPHSPWISCDKNPQPTHEHAANPPLACSNPIRLLTACCIGLPTLCLPSWSPRWCRTGTLTTAAGCAGVWTPRPSHCTPGCMQILSGAIT